ncbi:MAG: TRAP transporter substrate-binding protein DctP [Proteobacteria bacterium]|nr:TRAP transporter substrate-binding protein DctP [Pseudomonadota bacterium]MBI3496614.1 TRAP transporter substrate-binding protein DctP [Pseudomonadota bacterium]
MLASRIIRGLAMAVGLFAFGMALPASAQKVTIKFATVVPDGPAAEILAMKAFKSYVEFHSDKAIEVRLFLGSVGGEREITEQVKQGTLEMGLSADGAVAGFYKEIQVFSIPYLFPSAPVAWAFFDHPFAQKLAEDMRQKTGIRTLSFSENGFRNLTNNVRPIKTPDDMKGIKMRTMESPVFMTFMRSLGAAPTPISAAEMVLALKQGVVDGQENPTLIIHDFGIADVQKYMSMDEHIYSLHLVMINDEFYAKLPTGYRQIVQDGARVLRGVSGTRKAALQEEYVGKIKAKGVQVYITSPEEKEAFRKASQEPVRKFIEEQVGKELTAGLLSAVADASKSVYGF